MQKNVLDRSIEIALVAALLAATSSLLARAWFELSSGALADDALLFQTVGNGIRNGLTPYVDLFETKPPGVFLLSALSWKLFDSQFLVKLLQAICLLGIPIAVFFPAVTLAQGRSAGERRAATITSLLFGILLALYTADQAGLGLAESYGAFFALCFLAYVQCSNAKSTIKYIVLGVLLLLSVSFKEPFILSVAGAMLLLPKSEAHNSSLKSQVFVIPILIATLLGTLTLSILGYFRAFFDNYLSHMLGYHVVQYEGSTFVRALEVWRTFINLGAFSWVFAVLMTLLLIFVAYRSIKHRSFWWIASVYLALLSIAVGGDFYGHHFVFGLPVFAALWWKAVEYELPKSISMPLLITTAVTTLQLSYAEEVHAWKQKEALYTDVAARIDTLMEDCGWDRYLQMIPRGSGPYAYTTHSPYGPIFVLYERFIGAKREYQTAYIRALQEAPFMLVADVEQSNLSEFAMQYVGVHYSEQPPECAGEDFSIQSPYSLLFRKN